jgi:hypothetical protein
MHRFAANGYEVTGREKEVLFIDRRAWWLGWLMVVRGTAAALSMVLIGLSIARATLLPPNLSRYTLPAAAGCLLGAWAVSRTYHRRLSVPVEDIPDILIIDCPSRALRDRMGQHIAKLTDVRARMHIDWWTRGAMRTVALSWPGGRRTVFRTFGRRQCLDLLAFLQERGLDAK